MRQKLDNRIRTLIENGVTTGHRSMFAVVGDKGKDQVPILHHILTKAAMGSRPSVLWCYKKDLGFTSHRKKRMREIERKAATSNATINEDDHFEVFISSTQIRYCYYSETHTILGNTFGMLVLQDFEAMTPNLLARTIETVEGGGVVVFLMKSVSSLRQLYTLAMDVHNRYRTESQTEVVARFNERFILSLSSSSRIAVLDDQLTVLPISSHITKIEKIPHAAKSQSASESELKTMKEAMKDTKPVGPLLDKCRTACQGKALLRLLDVITEKTLNATCSITAARGRGKSASLGLSLAGAIAFGYTNIFVTSPSPENLRTLFEFVVKGFDALDYQEHTDYELVQSTNPDFNKALVRINVFRDHRQVIQYIHPSDAAKLGQAEIVVVDEAAAIPLPLVKDLISGPYLVFLASTINGYEGTGRSLSLKLLQQLRQQSAGCAKGAGSISKGRILHEMQMEESIRYKPGDEIEKWLNKVLCLDACSVSERLTCGCPPPKDCELYYVNRDTLFSFHKASEAFLHQMMGIYVSAHYKNTPNDLQMLSDAPAHHLFVLMAPVKEDQNTLPEVLAVIQVCMEGNLSKDSVSASLERGKRAAGDLLPWTISQQFLDNDFPTLVGARIVRVAVHPDYQSMGYGSRALALLEEYFMGNVQSLDENDTKKAKAKEKAKTVTDGHTVALLEEQLAPRADLPPLLLRLTERKPEKLDYLGVSFGLTLNLLKFWKKAGYVPVYLRQTQNELTGEYTCIMLKDLRHDEVVASWLSSYWQEFRGRLIHLLSFEFAAFPSQLGLSLLQLRNKNVEQGTERHAITREQLALFLSNSDMKRLSQFAKNMVDHQLITDLLPTIAMLYFNEKLPADTKISVVQAAVLLGMGIQRKTVAKIRDELDLPENQVLALFSKTIRKLSDCFDSMCQDAIRRVIDEGAAVIDPEEATQHLRPLQKSIEEDLEDAADEIRARQVKDKKEMLKSLDKEFHKYAIDADEKALEQAFKVVSMPFSEKIPSTISVRSKRPLPSCDLPKEKDPHAKRKMKVRKNKVLGSLE